MFAQVEFRGNSMDLLISISKLLGALDLHSSDYYALSISFRGLVQTTSITKAGRSWEASIVFELYSKLSLAVAHIVLVKVIVEVVAWILCVAYLLKRHLLIHVRILTVITIWFTSCHIGLGLLILLLHGVFIVLLILLNLNILHHLIVIILLFLHFLLLLLVLRVCFGHHFGKFINRFIALVVLLLLDLILILRVANIFHNLLGAKYNLRRMALRDYVQRLLDVLENYFAALLKASDLNFNNFTNWFTVLFNVFNAIIILDDARNSQVKRAKDDSLLNILNECQDISVDLKRVHINNVPVDEAVSYALTGITEYLVI